MIAKTERIVDFYLLAKNTVIGEGFSEEIEWQGRLKFVEVDERSFLREAAWVVLSAGMREAVVRRKFEAFSGAFYHWLSARQIVINASGCKRAASAVFNHPKKISSIVEIAQVVDCTGFEVLKRRIGSEGVDFLQALPYIGPISSYHLAKNIGLDVVKPDRHLLRISALAGYSNPLDMCQTISSIVGDRPAVVDLVVWRYATLNPGYRHFLNLYLH